MNSRVKVFRRLLVFLLFVPAVTFGQLSLPKLVSDGMVLQRNTEVNIWGWAKQADSVTVHFRNETYQAVVNENDEWQIELSKMKAGGPYSMIISAGDTVRVNDIMVGEIWVSSGQSNMELPMRRVRPIYESEIADAVNDDIRYFDVPQSYDFNGPEQRLSSGHWQKTTPETVLEFSAVAYFFAQKLHQKYQVPVGIINASVGGSPAEAWISESALRRSFPRHYDELQRFKDSSLVKKIQQQDRQRRNEWYRTLNQQDRGLDGSESWYGPNLNTSDWSRIEIPGYWTDTNLSDVNGSVWFRKEVEVSSDMAGKPAKLLLGRIVDADSVFVNGTFVGTTSYQYPPRRYDVPGGVLKNGENTIAIRVINERGQGGFFPDKPYQLIADKQTIDLKGEWKYKLGSKMEPLPSQTFIRWKPVGLYNAMIAPLHEYTIQGVIWYQGESNTGRPVEYRNLFATLIRDWRVKWNQGQFPFLFVQLANFMEAAKKPTESNWAMLREAQRQTLSLPNTGMAVTIDIGEWNDIHPLNKKDVGRRLARAAQKVAYNEKDMVYSGPMYKSMKKKGKKVVLSFNQTGSGLMAKGEERLKGFAIAGPDCNFVWADAEIKEDQIIVWSDQVKNPKVVRYAWADNPIKANLYNEEGLPASPFSTSGLKQCKAVAN